MDPEMITALIGVRLDGAIDWDEIEAICQEAYRTVAPARLLRD